MSYFLYNDHKRGRPMRFDTQGHAILVAVITTLDARSHTRGRKPDTSAIVIADADGVITITDSYSNSTLTVKDSVKVKCERTTLIKKVKSTKKRKVSTPEATKVDVDVASTGAITPIANVAQPKSIKPHAVIDVAAMKAKIDKLNNEAEVKKLDV